MVFGEIDVTVKSYLGILDGGILTLLSVKKNNIIYEGTFWYNEHKESLITFESMIKINPDEFEMKEELTEYLIQNVAQYKDIYPKLEKIEI